MSTSLPTVTNRYSRAEIRSFYEAGHWCDETLLDVLDERCASLADEPFASDSTTVLTYGALRERAFRVAAGLARSGVASGDRVVLQLPNWTDFIVAAVAVARRGAIVVPIMPIYRHDEVGYVLEHSGARAAITCEHFGGFDHASMFVELMARSPELEAVYVARATAPPSGTEPFTVLEVEGSPETLATQAGPRPGPDDGHLIIYTSGTTARPKGCFHTWNTIAYTLRVMTKNLGITASDVAFGPSPITHATGYVTSVLMPLFAGGRTHLMEAWNPEQGMARIAEHGCTTTVTATAFLQMVLDAYDPQAHDLSSMRLWVAAGSPIPSAVIERARKALPEMEVLSLYGRSENMVTSMCNTGDDPQLSLTSDGCAPEGVQIGAVDAEGRRLASDREGDLVYKGPGHMLEYFRAPEQTAELFTPEGFSRSGDLGVVNAQGYLRVTGRLKDIIIRGGMNISAVEVEELLLEHPDVSTVAVVAMPDERLGEKACAYVVAAPGTEPSLSSLRDFLRDVHQFAIQKMPERLEVVEALPMTATGKVQKHVLRADIAAKLEREGAGGT